MNERWVIVQALVGASKNSNELRRLVKTLMDDKSRRQVVDVLRKIAGDQQDTRVLRIKRAQDPNPVEVESDIELVRTLFRNSLKFRITEIEEWLKNNYDVTEPVNKESLSVYLKRVFKNRPYRFLHSVINDLYREVARRGPTRPELKEFADKLDKRGKKG